MGTVASETSPKKSSIRRSDSVFPPRDVTVEGLVTALAGLPVQCTCRYSSDHGISNCLLVGAAQEGLLSVLARSCFFVRLLDQE